MGFWLLGALTLLLASTVFYDEADQILEEIQDFIDGDDEQQEQVLEPYDKDNMLETPVILNCPTKTLQNNKNEPNQCGYTASQTDKQGNLKKPNGLKGKHKVNPTSTKQQSNKKNDAKDCQKNRQKENSRISQPQSTELKVNKNKVTKNQKNRKNSNTNKYTTNKHDKQYDRLFQFSRKNKHKTDSNQKKQNLGKVKKNSDKAKIGRKNKYQKQVYQKWTKYSHQNDDSDECQQEYFYSKKSWKKQKNRKNCKPRKHKKYQRR